jgi:hypothetical protein
MTDIQTEKAFQKQLGVFQNAKKASGIAVTFLPLAFFAFWKTPSCF